MVMIRAAELIPAYAAFRKIRKLPANNNSRILFFEFIGIQLMDKTWLYEHTPISDGTARKIKWLTGPHAEVMYKIWEAQHQ